MIKRVVLRITFKRGNIVAVSISKVALDEDHFWVAYWNSSKYRRYTLRYK